jgi:hypothetical protein
MHQLREAKVSTLGLAGTSSFQAGMCFIRADQRFQSVLEENFNNALCTSPTTL